MNRYIKVTQMLDEMKQTLAGGSPKPFRIGYLLADKTRKTGGQYRMLKCTLYSKKNYSGSKSGRSVYVKLYGTNDIQEVHFDNILYFNDQPTS